MPDKIRFIPYRSFLPESFKQKTPIPDRDEGSPRGATLLRLRKETHFYGNNGPPPVPPTPARFAPFRETAPKPIHAGGDRLAPSADSLKRPVPRYSSSSSQCLYLKDGTGRSWEYALS